MGHLRPYFKFVGRETESIDLEFYLSWVKRGVLRFCGFIPLVNLKHKSEN